MQRAACWPQGVCNAYRRLCCCFRALSQYTRFRRRAKKGLFCPGRLSECMINFWIEFFDRWDCYFFLVLKKSWTCGRMMAEKIIFPDSLCRCRDYNVAFLFYRAWLQSTQQARSGSKKLSSSTRSLNLTLTHCFLDNFMLTSKWLHALDN